MVDLGHFSDLVEVLERDALAIDRTGDTALVHMLFRTAHNLKSSIAMEGFDGLAHAVHELEDLLDRIRRGQRAWDSRSFDAVTGVVDQVRQFVLSDAAEPAGPQAREAPAAPAGDPRWGLPLDEPGRAACAQAVAAGQGIYRIDKLFRRGLSREAFEGLPVMEDVRELGTLIAVAPDWEAYAAGPEEQVVKLLFASTRSAGELAGIIFDPLLTLQPPAGPGPVTGPGRGPGPLRILVIEDDQAVGHLLQYILKQQGHCELCASGEAGLARFHEALAQGAGFDLVLLDLLLPGIHGDDILRAIRETEFKLGIHSLEERCAVIISTASEDLDQLMRSLTHDPDGYLIKPVDMDVLLGKVEAIKARHGLA